MLKYSAVRKILFIRFSSIGDIVLTSPVLRCVKAQLPDVEIHVATKPQYAALFETNPNVAKVHLLQHDMRLLISELQSENFSYVVDLHKNFRSARIRWALKKPSASFPKLNLKKYLLVRFKMNFMPDTHIVDRYFEAVKPLHVVNDGAGLDYFIPESTILPDKLLPEKFNKRYCAVVIGGQHFTKIFPAEKIVEVFMENDMSLILLGGKEDAARGEWIAAQLGSRAINLAGKLDLNQSALCIKNADCVLTNDTGLMHISAALQKPTVSLWGNTLPSFGMYPYMPVKRENSLIIENKEIKCRPCSKLGHPECPEKHFDCMLTLNAKKIAEALQQMSLND